MSLVITVTTTLTNKATTVLCSKDRPRWCTCYILHVIGADFHRATVATARGEKSQRLCYTQHVAVLGSYADFKSRPRPTPGSRHCTVVLNRGDRIWRLPSAAAAAAAVWLEFRDWHCSDLEGTVDSCPTLLTRSRRSTHSRLGKQYWCGLSTDKNNPLVTVAVP